MIVKRNNVLLFFAFFLNPFASVFLSLGAIKKNNIAFTIIIVSSLVFVVTLLTPPYQDLYRRYITTYYLYDPSTTLWEALEGKVDFLFYFFSWMLYKLDLPFYLIPALFSSVSCYCTLSAANHHWQKNNNEVNKGIFLIGFLCIFSFVNVIMIASTLRFGLAVALFVKAISLYFLTGKKNKAYFYFIFSLSCHISLLLPLTAFFISRYFKISWFTCFILSLAMYMGSHFIIPLLLNIVNLGYINDYITVGYLSTDYANVTNNANTLLVQMVKWLLLVFFIILLVRHKSISPQYDNFIKILIVVSAMTALSATIFNRYFIGVLTPIVVIGALSNLSKINYKPLLKLALMIVLIFNITVINVFLERRQIIMASMWEGLYVPPVFHLLYNMDKFNGYLNEIDSDGNWVKNKLAE